ncbi:rhodanese-like domain-containing protein [Kribbella sp. NPDC050281]|uniref:rhodanese-like domain-containing protein n=1 Tax=Kribbella sp. NPDC050281 TaxID=3155515 RepID=UPI0033CEBA9B
MGIEETLATAWADLTRLEPAEALEAIGVTGTYIVDIRPEYQRRAAGEVPVAIVIERNHLEWRLDPSSDARIPEAVDASIRWIILCEGGYASSLAAQSLRRLGLLRSTDVIGGFEAWRAAGLPVDRPDRPRRPRGPGEGRWPPPPDAGGDGRRRSLV